MMMTKNMMIIRILMMTENFTSSSRRSRRSNLSSNSPLDEKINIDMDDSDDDDDEYEW